MAETEKTTEKQEQIKKPAAAKKKVLLYKGKPLMRSGDTIYYGDAAEKYMIKLDILEKAPAYDTEVGSKVSVCLIGLENGYESILKKGEKSGVFDGLDIGGIWLERTLAEKTKN